MFGKFTTLAICKKLLVILFGVQNKPKRAN